MLDLHTQSLNINAPRPFQWLRSFLSLQKSSVERSGAAQGLAEVLAVLGRSHVDALLPELLSACSSPMPFVREGNLTLFRFLPQAIPDMFQVRLISCFILWEEDPFHNK